MKTIQVKFEGTVELFVVTIDMQKLSFTEGLATKNLKEEQDYPIQWFVRGHPESKYKIEITKPTEATFIHSATLDSHMKDAGVFWFRLKSDGGGE